MDVKWSRLSAVRGQWSAVSGLFLLLLVAGCRGGSGDQASARPPDTLLVLNGVNIPREKFENFIRFSQGELGEGDRIDVPRHELFREFVVEQLLLQEADREGIEVEEAEVQEQLAKWSTDDGPPSDEWVERVQDLLRSQKFARQKIASGVAVGLEELQKYYHDHEEEFIVDDGAHVLEILVSERALAEQLRKRLRPGDVRTFKATAQRHSQGTHAASGGDLGLFRRGELPEAFEKIIFSLRAGQISPVFQSVHGFHIFMMEEFIRRHHQKFYEVQEIIFDRLMAEKERAALEDYLSEIIKKSSIEVYDETLRSEWRRSNERKSE